MADASYIQSSFHGGEWAASAQGNVGIPQYRTAMNVCLNGIPIEAGAWTRRPGSIFCNTTRNGNPGRLVTFDFIEANSYTFEFTDGYMRAWNGTALSTTNDSQSVVSISTANPAVVTTGTHGWTGTISGGFSALGANNPLLQNRVFLATVTGSTTFTLADAVTGATIDGSTLGTFVSGTFNRVQEIVTPYVGGAWSTLRQVQATTSSGSVNAVLLHADFLPYIITVDTLPSAGVSAQFSIAPSVFKDGPYFDPVPGGTLLTPGSKTGNITCSLSFNAYDSTRSYTIGDYVTSSSVNYKSIIDANLNNTPASVPTAWTPVSSADAINGTSHAFLGTDIGRLVRVQSAPPLWAVGGSYSAGQAVAYGSPEVFWSSITNSNVGNIPGADIFNWALAPNASIWSWGKITSLSNIIDRALAGSANIGSMTNGGGNAAAFDGIQVQASGSAAEQNFSGSCNPSDLITLSSYVGKNYTSSSPSTQAIGQAIVYPTSDIGYITAIITDRLRGSVNFNLVSITLNLRGKATTPSSSSDGTVLGSSGNTPNSTSLIVIPSSSATAWKFVWIELVVQLSVPSFVSTSSAYTASSGIAEVAFYNPPGTGTSQGIVLQLLGPNLLYTSAIRTWRLGLYSNTTGFPTCGTYHEGRLWLSGLVGNRVDGSVPDDPYNFAPTQFDGTVTDSNAIDYTFNSPDVNPIFSMTPDQQGIICGTQAGEWLIQATTLNAPLTPTSIQAHRVTKVGHANIEPRRTDHTLVFVQKYGRKLIEYFADVFSGKFAAPNLSKFVKHLMVNSLQEIAYQQELVPIIWARDGAGALLSCTYQRDSLMSSQGPTIMGWGRHTLGSGRIVESIAVGPSNAGNLSSLSMVTNDTVANVRHVEMVSNFPDDNLQLVNAWHLDNAVTPTSTSSTSTVFTINGLWHLNGKTVRGFAGGIDLGNLAVVNGSASLNFGSDPGGLFTNAFVTGYSGMLPVVVGFQYNSDGQLVRPIAPAESGARSGPAFGKKKRTHGYAMQLLNTQNLLMGTDFGKLNQANFRTSPDGGNALPITSLKTGLHIGELTDDQSFDSMICWRVSGPFPATVVIVGGYLQTQDK